MHTPENVEVSPSLFLDDDPPGFLPAAPDPDPIDARSAEAARLRAWFHDNDVAISRTNLNTLLTHIRKVPEDEKPLDALMSRLERRLVYSVMAWQDRYLVVVPGRPELPRRMGLQA